VSITKICLSRLFCYLSRCLQVGSSVHSAKFFLYLVSLQDFSFYTPESFIRTAFILLFMVHCFEMWKFRMSTVNCSYKLHEVAISTSVRCCLPDCLHISSQNMIILFHLNFILEMDMRKCLTCLILVDSIPVQHLLHQKLTSSIIHLLRNDIQLSVFDM
jgi:hypothetical protein